jgi:hypothetical protein
MNPSHHYVEGVAAGTGPHNHHRGRLERDGAAVGYSVCMMGTGPLRACPDEPDPLERLLVKLAERRRPVERAEEPRSLREPAKGWLPCPTVPWHGTSFKYLNKAGHQVCRECQRDRNTARRRAA